MQKLTKAEEEIMQMFWDHGPSTVSELIDLMDEPKPPHSSVSSIVRILEKKEFLAHEAAGRSYRYNSIVDKRDYSKFSIKKLVSNYFEGSMKELVSFLVKEEDLSLSELERIKIKIEKEEKS
jgi:predicted transcriptional regulator